MPAAFRRWFSERRGALVALGLVIVVSNWTIFRDFGFPNGSFFDESYYIADAQKYLNGVFFMRDHPPLAKLLMAAGEAMLQSNREDSVFLSQMSISEFPSDFVFLGYRFFPALLSWMTAPLAFLIFLALTRSPALSLWLSTLVMFDNAFIAHGRGALLDGTLQFFCALAILGFVRSLPRVDGAARGWLVLFGGGLGLSLATKMTAGILLPLIPYLCWVQRHDWRRAVARGALVCLTCGLAYTGVWQIHFHVARIVNPALEHDGYFDASASYRTALDDRTVGRLSLLPPALVDSWRFMARVNSQIAPYDRCNTADPGSPVWMWPLGGRAIDYRHETSDQQVFRYVYLQPNPAIWWGAFAAVLTATAMLLASAAGIWRYRWRQQGLLVLLTSLYWLYLIGLASLRRVLYLNSYFVGLLLAFAVTGLLVAEFHDTVSLGWRRTVVTVSTVAVIACYAFYYPLTYYRPLSNAEFARRSLIPLWGLRCGNCPPANPCDTPKQ